MTMAMRMYDLEHLQHFREPVRDSRVALAWNRTTIMLAFRGTASLKNAQTDIKARFWRARCRLRRPQSADVTLTWHRASVRAG